MITNKVIEIIKVTFQNSKVSINLETTPNDVDEWDSLGHIMLIQAIEEKFDVSFELEELLEFETVKHIVDAVIKKTK